MQAKSYLDQTFKLFWSVCKSMTGGSVLSKANRPIRIDNQVVINLDLRLAKKFRNCRRKKNLEMFDSQF